MLYPEQAPVSGTVKEVVRSRNLQAGAGGGTGVGLQSATRRGEAEYEASKTHPGRGAALVHVKIANTGFVTDRKLDLEGVGSGGG